MPFDDGDDEEGPARSPLPPDDRLWRHPSELGGVAATAEPATSNAPGPKLWGVAVVSGLVGAVLAIGVVAVAGGVGTTTVEHSVIERVPTRSVSELSSTPGQGVVALAKSVAPAIVKVTGVAEGKDPVNGSGVLFRDDGYLITNAHVVEGVSSVTITLADGSTSDGHVVGTDDWTDVGVVKVDRTNTAVATLGSANDLQAGTPAIAIGSPSGEAAGPSVTVGVVSAIGRKVQSLHSVALHDMIQTDAPLSPGSEGGPLVDGSGVVVGITTAVAPSSDPADNGLGFATPIDVAKQVADDIVATGSAHHVWLGIEGDDIDASTASTLQVAGGVRVTKVVDHGPSANAGVVENDVITAVNDAKVESMSALVVVLRGYTPGQNVTLTVRRGHDTRTMAVTLGEKDQP